MAINAYNLSFYHNDKIIAQNSIFVIQTAISKLKLTTCTKKKESSQLLLLVEVKLISKLLPNLMIEFSNI